MALGVSYPDGMGLQSPMPLVSCGMTSGRLEGLILSAKVLEVLLDRAGAEGRAAESRRFFTPGTREPHLVYISKGFVLE